MNIPTCSKPLAYKRVVVSHAYRLARCHRLDRLKTSLIERGRHGATRSTCFGRGRGVLRQGMRGRDSGAATHRRVAPDGGAFTSFRCSMMYWLSFRSCLSSLFLSTNSCLSPPSSSCCSSSSREACSHDTTRASHLDKVICVYRSPAVPLGHEHDSELDRVASPVPFRGLPRHPAPTRAS